VRKKGATGVSHLRVTVVVLVALAAGCAAASPRRGPVRGSVGPSTSSAPASVPRGPQGLLPAAAEERLPGLGEDATLSDYVAYAALANPGLLAAYERWQAALEQVPQARSLPDPRLTYANYIQEVETRVGPQRQRFGLSQTLPWPGKLLLQGDAAAEAAEAARERFEGERLRLAHRVVEAYCEYYYLGRSVAVVKAQRDLLERLEGVVRARYRASAAQYSDLVRVQVELGALEDRVRALEDMRGPAAARLNAAVGRPATAGLPWPQALPQEAVEVTDEQALAWLRESNPELRAMHHEVRRSVAEVRTARRGYIPDLTVGVEYVDTGRPIMDTPDAGKDPVVAMASVNLPIWFGKLNAAVRQARARERGAAHQQREAENRLAADVRMTLFELRDAARKAELYGDTLLPKARQALEASEAAFRAGKGPFVDLIDAVRVLLEFHLSYERAAADRVQRLAELEMLVGKAIPRTSAGDRVE
jgi:cobalt-zinc-cadmium efflux system outer membrane protein